MVDGKNLLSKNDLVIVHGGIMYDAYIYVQIYGIGLREIMSFKTC